MCGIFSIFNQNKLTIKENSFKKLSNLISHRGPDHRGIFRSKNFYSDLYQLSIYDKRAKQPYYNEDFILNFNGAIYNLKFLKEKYFSKNHIFKTFSDTEVIFEGYKLKGENFLKELVGMFAIQIYDKRKNKVIVFCDGTSQKQLYYYFDKKSKNFIFSSEIKPILQYSKQNKILIKLNKNYIINYLDRGNIYLPNETPYLEIKKVKPGFIFYFQNNVESKKVWEFKPTYSKKLNFNFFKKSLTNILNEHFKQKKLLCSTFSSGLDSSIITFYIQKILKIKNSISYSFDFKFGDNKEKFLIKKIVKKYKIKHKFVKIYKKDLFRKLNRYLNFKQIPIQSDNLFYLSILCESAKKDNFKVLISGDGADEIFLGYDKIKKIIFEKSSNYRFIKTNKSFKNLNYKKYKKYKFNEKKYTSIFKKNPNKISNEVLARFKLDIPSFTHNGDISGMMNSLEIRNPFLDSRLIRFVSKLKFQYLVSKISRKILLKEYAKSFIPKEILNQKQKYRMPSNLVILVYEILFKKTIQYIKHDKLGIYSKDALQNYYNDKKNLNSESAYFWFRSYQIEYLNDSLLKA